MKTVFILLSFFTFSTAVFSQTSNSDSLLREKKTAWILSSNFSLPTVQFNPYTSPKPAGTTASGQVSFFNSLGAGISLSKADFNLLTSKNDTTGSDIKNHFGIQTGFLFSRASGETKEISRFALYGGITILDFQLGIGREFGDVGKDIRRTFYTISYSIPMNKFLRNNTLVLKNRGGKGFGNKISRVNKAFSM